MTGTQSYTPEELAKILKITRFTVYEMIKRGDLPAYRIGRKVRVEAADLDAYINKSKGAGFPALPSNESNGSAVAARNSASSNSNSAADGGRLAE